MPILSNHKHELFAQAVASGKAVAHAYEMAGYKRHHANSIRLSKKEEIAARIAEILAAAGERVEITVSRVLEELGKIGFANMIDYVRVTKDGDAYVDLSSLDRDRGAAIQEITVEDFTEGRGEDKRDIRRTKFKLADKRAALVDIGKHLGMFKELVEHTGKDGGPIETSDYTDHDRAKAIAAIVSRLKQEEHQVH